MAAECTIPTFFTVISLSIALAHVVPPQDFFDDFTQGAPLRYVINLTNCIASPSFGPKIKATFLSDVISGGTLSSSSDDTWEMTLSSQKYINDKRYNISTAAVRVTFIPMSDQGQAYVYVYDLDPRSWKRLAVQDIICFTGQKKSEIAFVTTNQTKTTLYTYDDVSAALLSGGEVTFSFNLDKKSEFQFSYVVGRINDFSVVDSDIVFGIELPNELWTSVYNARLSHDNSVTLTSYQADRKSHSTANFMSYNGSIASDGSYRIYRLE